MTWHAAPALADIVWCRFPYRERSTQPAPVLHPALIIAVDDGSRPVKVVAVFGTSSVPAKTKPWQLLLVPGVTAFKDTGLTAATIFDFERRAVLPCDSRYFPDSPKIGTLPKHYMADAQSAMRAAVEQERLAS